MRKILIALLLLCGWAALGQNANDALRYSQLSYGGTARFTALSGAYGALGADFSSLSQNPAGIALYRKSEFTVSPGLFTRQVESSFYGKSSSDNYGNLTFNNVGLVLKFGNGGPDNFLKMVQLGFGFNRSNNFGSQVVTQGFNNRSSLLTGYEDAANTGVQAAGDLDPFTTGLAYETDLLVYDSAGGFYWVDMYNGGVDQKKILESKGSAEEMVLSAGANFGDMLYLGATLGFPSIDYRETSHFTESDSKGQNSYFDSFKRSESLRTTGTGINFKFGFIFKPVDFVRLGAAFHTPTRYTMTDEWNSSMTSWFDNGKSWSANSPDGTYNYELTTPMRAMGSIAFIIGNFGLLSADYEYLDYSTARLHADDYEFFDENEIISSDLTTAHNLRIGTEWSYNMLSFRGGTSFYGTPYKGEVSDGAHMGYSFGLGVHEKSYFLDFAFSHNLMKNNYYLYYKDLVDPARNSYKSNQFVMTLGLRF